MVESIQREWRRVRSEYPHNPLELDITEDAHRVLRREVVDRYLTPVPDSAGPVKQMFGMPVRVLAVGELDAPCWQIRRCADGALRPTCVPDTPDNAGQGRALRLRNKGEAKKTSPDKARR